MPAVLLLHLAADPADNGWFVTMAVCAGMEDLCSAAEVTRQMITS